MKKKPNNDNEISLPIAKRILPIEYADLNLSLREYKFTALYCTNGFKGPDAAEGAGYSGDRATLRGIAWDLLKRPNVAEAIKRFIDSVIAPYKTRLEYEILDRYYKRATYTVDIFCYEDGTRKPLDEIDKEWLQVIDGVERKFYGKGADVEVVSYILPNRDTALQTLIKLATGKDLNDNNSSLPQEARAKLAQIFNSGFPGGVKTGAESPVKTTTTLTVKQVVQQGKQAGAGRPRKYCKINKGQPCVHCNRCKSEIIDITPGKKGKK